MGRGKQEEKRLPQAELLENKEEIKMRKWMDTKLSNLINLLLLTANLTTTID